jgi:hypothetical protein
VIRTRATSIVGPPATTRSAVAVANPSRTSSTICDREAVREHHGFGAAVTACGEQFERARPPPAVGISFVITIRAQLRRNIRLAAANFTPSSLRGKRWL